MPEPSKVRIVAAAVDALKEISRSGGFFTDLGRTVERGYATLAEMNSTQFPRLALYFGKGVDDTRCMGSYGADDQLVVEASVRTNRADALEDEMLRAEADIFTAMMTDPRLGDTTAYPVEPIDWETERNNRTDDCRGRVYVRFAVRSTRSPAAP